MPRETSSGFSRNELGRIELETFARSLGSRLSAFAFSQMQSDFQIPQTVPLESESRANILYGATFARGQLTSIRDSVASENEHPVVRPRKKKKKELTPGYLIRAERCNLIDTSRYRSKRCERGKRGRERERERQLQRGSSALDSGHLAFLSRLGIASGSSFAPRAVHQSAINKRRANKSAERASVGVRAVTRRTSLFDSRSPVDGGYQMRRIKRRFGAFSTFYHALKRG